MKTLKDLKNDLEILKIQIATAKENADNARERKGSKSDIEYGYFRSMYCKIQNPIKLKEWEANLKIYRECLAELKYLKEKAKAVRERIKNHKATQAAIRERVLANIAQNQKASFRLAFHPIHRLGRIERAKEIKEAEEKKEERWALQLMIALRIDKNIELSKQARAASNFKAFAKREAELKFCATANTLEYECTLDTLARALLKNHNILAWVLHHYCLAFYGKTHGCGSLIHDNYYSKLRLENKHKAILQALYNYVRKSHNFTYNSKSELADMVKNVNNHTTPKAWALMNAFVKLCGDWDKMQEKAKSISAVNKHHWQRFLEKAQISLKRTHREKLQTQILESSVDKSQSFAVDTRYFVDALLDYDNVARAYEKSIAQPLHDTINAQECEIERLKALVASLQAEISSQCVQAQSADSETLKPKGTPKRKKLNELYAGSLFDFATEIVQTKELKQIKQAKKIKPKAEQFKQSEMSHSMREKSLIELWLKEHKPTICPDSYGFLTNKQCAQIL